MRTSTANVMIWIIENNKKQHAIETVRVCVCVRRVEGMLHSSGNWICVARCEADVYGRRLKWFGKRNLGKKNQLKLLQGRLVLENIVATEFAVALVRITKLKTIICWLNISTAIRLAIPNIASWKLAYNGMGTAQLSQPRTLSFAQHTRNKAPFPRSDRKHFVPANTSEFNFHEK